MVGDVSALTAVPVARIVRPRSTDEVRDVLRAWSGPVSIGGGRYSMGGQVAAPDSLHLDMRAMNAVSAFDPQARVIRVQAGATWRDVQDAIDPHDLSVAIMQSYSNFTVGGSVGVNCHGRYVGRGPLVNSVRAVRLVTAGGQELELARDKEPELFGAVFGGYGGYGVVTEVELALETNSRIERSTGSVALEEYPEHFRTQVLADTQVVMHNADLMPPAFDRPRLVTWRLSTKPLTESSRLVPRGLDYSLEKNALWAITELPGGSLLREKVVEPRLVGPPAVVYRNREASLDVASLEPRTRMVSTYLLQEYFVPVDRFVPFARILARILKAFPATVLNVSIRHSPADRTALMPWAAQDVFTFVVFYKQRSSAGAGERAAVWTRELIDAALALGGRYYLPYRLDATQAQFDRAYPEAAAARALKRRVDPRNTFRNLLWAKYLAAR